MSKIPVCERCDCKMTYIDCIDTDFFPHEREVTTKEVYYCPDCGNEEVKVFTFKQVDEDEIDDADVAMAESIGEWWF